ncbi:hypothetical protein MAH1_29820 [Sessilibacter sp. MAH1]
MGELIRASFKSNNQFTVLNVSAKKRPLNGGQDREIAEIKEPIFIVIHPTS